MERRTEQRLRRSSTDGDCFQLLIASRAKECYPFAIGREERVVRAARSRKGLRLQLVNWSKVKLPDNLTLPSSYVSEPGSVWREIDLGVEAGNA